MCQITVLPSGLVFHEGKGTTLREVLVREGLLLDFPCGGRGLCGQCKIAIHPPTESGSRGRNPLPDAELQAGLRLACQTVVEGDCTISLPEGGEREVRWRAPSQQEETLLPVGAPLMRRVPLRLQAPSLEDQRADWERLREALEKAAWAQEGPRAQEGLGGRAGNGQERSCPTLEEVPVAALESFTELLRRNLWQAEAVLEGESLVCLSCSREERIYGFAIDLGTTTVDVSLHNLETGRQIGRRTLLNRQSAFGADVISRVQSFQADRRAVREAALDTIREACSLLLEEARIPPRQVVRSVVVGNPIMIHIFHDLNPLPLASAPYIPLVSGMIRRPATDFSFSFQGYGAVETLPLISAFVGADTVGVILALDLEHRAETALAIDIGTNGEIVLSRDGSLITTSTAAGPAFEGAQIRCGMRALEGAVTSVTIRTTGEVSVKTIGAGRPRGICGSGLISGVAELLEAGLLDATGRLKDPKQIDSSSLRQRMVQEEGQRAFLLCPEERILITQKDIRELQLAKAAVRTGIDMLLEETGIRAGQLQRLRLAGNFGAGLDVPKAIRLGLIPRLPVERVDVAGNAALRGAALALVSRDYRLRAGCVHRGCRFLELAGKPGFQMRFAEAMFF